MRQLILPEDWDGSPTCVLEGEKAKYLGRVLRMDVGSAFPARDARGRNLRCTVTQASPSKISLSVEVASEDAVDSARIRIVLVQGLLTGPRMDLVVRQAAEAGVAAIIPLIASRSLPAPGEGGSRRSDRWARVVREARQQSGSSIATSVAEPVGLEDLESALAAAAVDAESPRVLLHEAPLAHSTMHGYLTGARTGAVLCVGPEGGFAPREVEILSELGFKPLRLEGAILRAETAALYAVAAAQIVLSERSSWIPKPE